MSSTPQTDWSILVTLPPRSDIPRASDVITECCGSVLMSGVTYEYGRLRVEALAGVTDPVAQVAKWRAMEEAYVKAYELLEQAEGIVKDYVSYHGHEWDGTGYYGSTKKAFDELLRPAAKGGE